MVGFWGCGHFKVSRDKIRNWLFIYVFLLLSVIPASSIINIKMISIVSLFIYCLIDGVRAKQLIIFIFITIFNIFYLLYSIAKPEITTDLALRAFLGYQGVALAAFALLWGSENYEKKEIFNFFLIFIFLYSLIKSILMFAPNYAFFIAAYPGFDAVSREGFLRIVKTTDILLPLAIFLIINKYNFHLKINKILLSLMFISIISAVVLTFTRYIWILTFFVLFTSIIKRENLKYIFKSFIIIIFILFIILFVAKPFVASFTPLQDVIEYIFIRSADSLSLSVKLEQTNYLLTNFGNAPVFGSGNAAYIQEYIRHDRLPYIYEVQWLAILYQFGIVGTSLIILFVLLPISPMLKYIINIRLSRVSFIMLIFYILLLASGLINPYLFTLNSSILYFMSYNIFRFLIIEEVD